MQAGDNVKTGRPSFYCFTRIKLKGGGGFPSPLFLTFCVQWLYLATENAAPSQTSFTSAA